MRVPSPESAGARRSRQARPASAELDDPQRPVREKRPAGSGRGAPHGAIEALARALQRPVETVVLLDEAEVGRFEAHFAERCRQANAAADSERALSTSTADRLVIESLFGWLAARLPQGREVILMQRRPDLLLPVHAAAQEALVAAPELVREAGDAVRLMFPDGAFGLALEMVADPAGAEGRIYKVFAWGAPR